MDQEILAQLLSHGNEAGTACRTALLDGAELILRPGSTPTDRMLTAYQRRHTRTIADDVESIGFTEALDSLRRAGTRELNLGHVTASEPPFVYMIFMTSGPPTLVACVGIARD